MIVAFIPDPHENHGLELTKPPPEYLGWREPSFEATSQDYCLYEHRALDVLSRPRGRAALLRGGIVWRLAMEILGEAAIDEAVNGPSSDTWLYGSELMESRGSSWLCDDLSSYEVDIICGVYKVYTGTSSRKVLRSMLIEY